MADATNMLAECDILIDDTTGISPTDMKAKLRRLDNLGMVVVDYLQLMQSGRNIDNRVQEVSDISRNLIANPTSNAASLLKAQKSAANRQWQKIQDEYDKLSK